jgi:hypothetical protein
MALPDDLACNFDDFLLLSRRVPLKQINRPAHFWSSGMARGRRFQQLLELLFTWDGVDLQCFVGRLDISIILGAPKLRKEEGP